jgi:AcrR family transcriptional regulator
MDAARELFARHPYEAVTLAEIAKRVGCTPPTIMNHFGNKEGLFFTISEQDFRALRAQFERIEKVADPVERLRRIGLAYVEFAMAHPNTYRFLFMMPHPEPDPAAPSHDRSNPDQDACAFLRATVAEAIAAGRLLDDYDDPDLVAQLLWSGVHGLVSLHLNKGDDPCLAFRPVMEAARALVEAMNRGILKGGD